MLSSLRLGVLSSFLIGTLVACAPGPIGDNDYEPGPGGGGGGGGGGGYEPPPEDPSGTYLLRSNFDLATNIPGATGDVLNTLIDIGDGPHDPATWILDLLADKVGALDSLLGAARPFLDALVNGQIEDHAPDALWQVIEVSERFGDVVHKFGIESELRVAKSGGGYRAEHVVTGVVFHVNGKEERFTAAAVGLSPTKTQNVEITYHEGLFAIDQHDLDLSYGKLMVFALTQVVIPSVDPTADDLYDLLSNIIDCDAIGELIDNEIGFGGVSVWSAACSTGLAAGAGVIEDKLGEMALGETHLDISGTAQLSGTDLRSGRWDGDVVFDATPVPLSAAEQRFTGTRR